MTDASGLWTGKPVTRRCPPVGPRASLRATPPRPASYTTSRDAAELCQSVYGPFDSTLVLLRDAGRKESLQRWESHVVSSVPIIHEVA